LEREQKKVAEKQRKAIEKDQRAVQKRLRNWKKLLFLLLFYFTVGINNILLL
jgi:hypothetical protein